MNDNADPRKWLEKIGFNDDNLCAKIPSKRVPWVLSTAMYEAAARGEIHVCKYLRKQGASATIRTKVNSFSTPLLIACEHSHLDIAQWLLTHGAADVADECADNGGGPSGGGPSGGGGGGGTVATVVVGKGALLDQVGGQARALRQALAAALCAHRDFAGLVVPAVCGLPGRSSAAGQQYQSSAPPRGLAEGGKPIDGGGSGGGCVRGSDEECAGEQGSAARARGGAYGGSCGGSCGGSGCCLLPLLAGHEATLLALVADFAGVERGRRLRRLREAHDHLAAAAHV